MHNPTASIFFLSIFMLSPTLFFYARGIIKNILFIKLLTKLSSTMTRKADNSTVAEYPLCKDALLFQEFYSLLTFFSSLPTLATFQFSHYILILQILSPTAKNENHQEITISITTVNWLSSGFAGLPTIQQ